MEYTKIFDKPGIYNISYKHKFMTYSLHICTIVIIDYCKDSPIVIKNNHTKETENFSIKSQVIINHQAGLIFSLEYLIDSLNTLLRLNPDIVLTIKQWNTIEQKMESIPE